MMNGRDVICTDVSMMFGALPVVAPVDLTLQAGLTTAFVGPSGCGKSTLLRMVAGLETPTTGQIRIGNETPSALAGRGGLAMAFQDHALLPWKTVRGNIALGRKLARKPADARAVQDLIKRVGLVGFEDVQPAALSGGMRQRAAIARCLISEPELMLLDEPFGAVDLITRQRLNADLPSLWRNRGTTGILVTHSVEEAVQLADRIIVWSQRPMSVLADITVDIDGDTDRRSAKFQSVVNQVTDSLYGAVA